MPLVAAAAITAGGAILSNRSNNRAQQQSAQASQAATDTATAEQRRQYDLSRADNQPWLQAGQGALGQLGQLYGLSGQAGQGNVTQPMPTGQGNGQFGSFWQSPDYQFRQNEQARALTARNAALGIQDSGAAQRSALQLSGNLASAEYNNYANRLAALAGVGQTAAGQNQQLGQNYAGAVGSLALNNADNLASSYQARGQNTGNLWGGLAGIGSAYIGQQWPMEKAK